MDLFYKSASYKLLLFLNIGYFIFCIAFGNNFYRLGVGAIKISEVIVLVSILVLVVFKRGNILPFFLQKKVLAIVVLSVLYFIYSLLVGGRESYYILRQFSSFLYFAYIPFAGYLMAGVNDQNFKKMHYYVPIFILMALGISTISKGANIDGSVLVIILLFTLLKKNVSSQALWGFGVLLCAALVGHAGHVLSLAAYFTVIVLSKNKGLLLPISVFLVFIMFAALPFVISPSEFTDKNATWRLVYWGDMISFLASESYLIFGEGYGVPYLRYEFSNYFLLVGQIGNDTELDYQIMTTPSHNSFINTLYHLGIIGLFLYLAFIFDLFKKSVLYNDMSSIALLVGCLLVVLTHNAFELPYMALPVSAILGYIYQTTENNKRHN